MDKIYLGIDNGPSGSIGIVPNGLGPSPQFLKTPVTKQQDYTIKVKNINRLNAKEFFKILEDLKKHGVDLMAILEKPFINAKMFNTSVIAARCFEAQLCILESLEIPYQFISAQQWQKPLLPHVPLKKKDGETSKEKQVRVAENRRKIKKTSVDIGIRLFPTLNDAIEKQGDADGLLIAEYARRQNL